MISRYFLFFAVALCGFAQSPAVLIPDPSPSGGLKQREELPPQPGAYRVESGTHVLLNMINSVSTKQASVGDRLYLETAFPVMANGRIVVPQGSWVTGTITEVKRPGRVKGRGELRVRFDSLTLPNGVTRDFRAGLDGLDGRAQESMNREKNTVKGPSDKKGDAETVADTTIAGAGIGAAVGAAAGHVGAGAGIGAGVGAAAGLMGVLLSRGPDAMLTKGTTVEMVIDRPLAYTDQDLDFSKAPPRGVLSEGTGPQAKPTGGFGRRTPF